MKKTNLYSRNNLNIKNVQHLSFRLGIAEEALRQVASNPEKFYRPEKREPKESGGERIINPPKPYLMDIQRKINVLLQEVSLPESFYGAVKGKNNIANANKHVQKEFVGCFDIKEFFPSIKYARIKGLFLRLGCTIPVSTLLAKITTYKGAVPQGAPTSSSLANLVIAQHSLRLEELARKHKLEITFFQDDMTVSGSFDVNKIRMLVVKIFKQIVFIIHEGDKLKIQPSHKRQAVTGIVVNRKLNVTKKFKKKVNDGIRLLKKQVLIKSEIRSLRGKISYFKQVNPAVGQGFLNKFNAASRVSKQK